MTIDFSCETSKSGWVSRDWIPTAFNLRWASRFSDLPDRRAGLSMTRTLTPRLCAATSARMSRGSEKRNIFTRMDVFAAAIAARTGRIPSSGSTTSSRVGFRVMGGES